MKKLLLIAALVVSSLCMKAEVIWSGESPINWNTGTSESVAASKFAKAQVGDQIVITFDFTGKDVSWPQVALYNGSWQALPGAGNTGLSDGMTSVTYYITNDMLTDLLSAGLLLTGHGYTLKTVELKEGPGAAGYENAVWIGETKCSWTGIVLPKSCFGKAKVGNYLRLNYKDLSAGAMCTIVDGSWNAISGYGFDNLSGTYQQYTIDATLLAKLQDNGCIINGTGYTMTSIDVIDPEGVSTLTASVPITNGWEWEGTDPEITINVTNPYDEAKSVTATVNVNTDKLKYYTKVSKTEEVAAKSSTSFTLSFKAEPGIYQIVPLVNGDAVKTTAKINNDYATSFMIAVDPEKIVSAPDMQSDFESFWTNTKEELARIAPEYTLTEITSKSTSKRKVYLLEYKSLTDNGDTAAIARAYYAEPTAPGTHPAIIHYQGYDSGDYDPWCPGGNDNPDYAELVLATRGQLINNRAPYTNNYGDWFQYGFGNKDTYYYRGAFMDAVRAIDFIYSREKIDTLNVFAEGASQGGALTIAAAALGSHKFNCIAPSIPFLGDFPDYFEVASWPAYPAHQQQAALGMSDEEMFKFLSYFDTKNLATLITCPVIETIGLQDNVCPPHTNLAPYNNLPASVEKEISYNATLQHATPSTWYSTYLAFFKKHTKDATGIADVNDSENDDENIYTLQGIKVSAPHRGIYIRNNKKYIAK